MRSGLSIIAMMSLLPVISGVMADDLSVEEIPSVETLPSRYPADWIFVHDMKFVSLVDGKVVLVDVASGSRHYKGTIGAAQFASFIRSRKRQELYVSETFYSRGTRGDRRDVLTIYDQQNLVPVGEVLLPGSKRGLSVTQKASLQLTGNEKFALVFNFTPAASVTIIDLDTREIINDVEIPGCSLIYPVGDQAFGTMCGNGTMTVFHIDDRGQAVRTMSTGAFNDIDHDPLFMKVSSIGSVTYFPSFNGNIQPVDLSGDSAAPLEKWSLLTDETARENWKPSGWQVITVNEQAQQLYVLMKKKAEEGDHKVGGDEVWVADPSSQKIIRRLPLKTLGISIEVTAGERPYLVVANALSGLDVYDAGTGVHIRTIGGGLAENPLVLHAVK